MSLRRRLSIRFPTSFHISPLSLWERARVRGWLLFPFNLNRYRELNLKSGLARTGEFIFFERPKKTNQKKSAPMMAQTCVWILVFCCALAMGYPYPNANAAAHRRTSSSFIRHFFAIAQVVHAAPICIIKTQNPNTCHQRGLIL